MPKTQAVDPRLAFAEQNLCKHKKALPEKAIDDLRFFGKLAAQGRPIGIPALQKWMLDNHGVKLGRTRLHSIAEAAGVEPWWKA